MSSTADPVSRPEPKANGSTPDKTVLEQMNSEYGILQEKLDKIGGFRTTIRGWSVTLVLASIIAAGSSKEVSPFFLSLLFVFIYAFYAMERKQNDYGTIFGARILHLEKRIRDELRAHSEKDPVLGFYPGIAHHLHSSNKGRQLGSFAWFRDPDRFFYVAQGAAVVIAMVVLALVGTTSKTPEIQNVFQIDSARPTSTVAEPADSRVPIVPQNSKEKKNVKSQRN